MDNQPEVRNRFIRHNPGSPRRSHRRRWDVTLAEAQRSLHTAEVLAPVANSRQLNPTLKIDEITREEDARKYPIYPYEALASVKLRRQIQTERGMAALIAATALGISTVIGLYNEIPARVASSLFDHLESAVNYLQRPQNEEIEDFRQKANRFHLQR